MRLCTSFELAFDLVHLIFAAGVLSEFLKYPRAPAMFQPLQHLDHRVKKGVT